MSNSRSLLASTVVFSSLTLLLSTSLFSAPQDYRGETRNEYRADHISTQGRITSISRDRDRYRITLDRDRYFYYVPMATVRDRQLRVGDDVRLGGFVSGNSVSVDLLESRGDPYYAADRDRRSAPYGSRGWMAGVVQRVDRHLGYLVIRDDSSGQPLKIDVRHMNLRKPVNVWGIRAGDHIAIQGTWEHRDTFDARRIEY